LSFQPVGSGLAGCGNVIKPYPAFGVAITELDATVEGAVDAWYPSACHTSLPPRRLTMFDDLQAYRPTSLRWSAVGSGSIAFGD
jgi:hypothetical protein